MKKHAIRYSLRARREEIDLLEYVLDQFGEKKAKEVYDRIEKLLKQISIAPEMYRTSNKRKNLRKWFLSKQTSIYYRIHGGRLEVVSFRDNIRDYFSFITIGALAAIFPHTSTFCKMIG